MHIAHGSAAVCISPTAKAKAQRQRDTGVSPHSRRAYDSGLRVNVARGAVSDETARAA